MINLLPPGEKQKLITETNQKVIIILGLVALVPLVCVMLVLLSLNFYLLGEINSKNIILAQAQKTYQTPDFLMVTNEMKKKNATMIWLSSFYNKEMNMSDVLQQVSGFAFPEEVYLTNLSIIRQDDEILKISATGFSQSRDDLLVFQKKIQEHPAIKELSFSPESWVNAQNATFQLTFQVQQ
ncbi:MAG: hypothetical protein A3D44_03745 [Candidatus Staskawiczbacteria bacterium RIFCSPHIGHO2_02_FULL_42_22]|uniref:Uncharacterized protein n=1 Tax=Candidatus Staskawiczbacteria bacterium RIFCSPHIGHO2_02_FULL_42_22 TaxID=1802207 RepID=A0A1G2I3V3_9BACT|nr:MAG: hypothetical protein A3D44_03745 [Candidatus Staskawiczbacteria bacterium RIFCSPHIGHO2_02_FULL_42_22]